MTRRSKQVVKRGNVVAAVVAVVAVGMAYTLLWGPLVRHHSYWVVPGDVWGTFRDAHIVGWGGEGILYASNIVPLTGYISLPAMPVLLAPVAALSSALHLTESLPFTLSRPSAWLLLGPVEMALGASVLFPLDALARRFGVPARTRAAAVWLEAALVWPVVAKWGHPEDLVAFGLGLCALMAAFDGRWRRAALLLGGALAFQPLVVVLAPLALALVPWRRWAVFVGYAAGPSAALLVAPLAHAWPTTVHTLLDQPTYPDVNHPTPWLALAHVLKGASVLHGVVFRHSSAGMTLAASSSHAGPTVAGGPVRLLPVAIALAIGAYVVWRRPPERTVWWLGAAALALRCVFEAVMTPYYAVPALALAVLLAAASSRMRLVVASVAAAACTYVGYRHATAWSYYLPMTLTLLATVASAVAPSASTGRGVPGGSGPAPVTTEPDLEPALV